MALILQPHESRSVSFVCADDAGHPATVQGIPTWTADETMVTIAPAADGLSATITARAAGWVSLVVTVTLIPTGATILGNTQAQNYRHVLDLKVLDDVPGQPWKGVSFQAIFTAYDNQFTDRLEFAQ